MFVGALALFLAGSAWIPFTTSLGPFIAARILTAIGGGAMVPVALAAVGDAFEERRRPGALGVLGAVDTIGWVWGPLFGALLVRFLDWRWQFYLNIPLALLAIAAAWWALAGLDRPAERRRIDWPAAASLSAALVCLNVALVNTSEISGVGGLEELTGRRSLPTVPFFVAAAVALGRLPLVRAPQRGPRNRPAPLPAAQLRPGHRDQLPGGSGADHRHGRRPPLREPGGGDRLERAAVLSGWVLSALTAAMALASWAGGRLTEAAWYRPPALAGLAVGAAAFAVMGPPGARECPCLDGGAPWPCSGSASAW